MPIQKLRLALIQFAATSNKLDNLTKMANLVREAAKNKAQLAILPECCNSPYGNQFFEEYSEAVPNGQSCQAFAKTASENKLYLIAGSVPEKFEGKLYNTTPVFGPDGKFIIMHRKVHLFDIDVPGKMTFQESKTLSAGNKLTTFETPFCKIGLGICYDIRFAEMAQIYTKQGCNLLVYPGAFNLTTGPAHWELLARGRAVDNQVYVAACGPARDATASYVSWGHSTVVSPWGEIVAKTDEKESIIYADLDFEYLQEVRKMIPTTQQKRHDLYSVENKSQI